MRDKITVRRFRPVDLRAVLRLEREAFCVDAWPVELFHRYAEDCARLFLVALVGQKIAGYSITCAKDDKAELDSIAVAERFRGRGVGGRLVRATLSKLRRQEVRTLWLTVKVSNASAIGMYQHFGFVRTRTVPKYYEDGSDGCRMKLQLNYSDVQSSMRC
jgi:ribosomal-protein-alanine N-acetyltransferase